MKRRFDESATSAGAEATRSNWSRKPVLKTDFESGGVYGENVRFQLFDIQSEISKNRVSSFQLFGSTMAGHSVMVHVLNPFLLVERPANFDDRQCHAMIEALNKALLSEDGKEPVLAITTVANNCLKILFASSDFAKLAKNMLNGGFSFAEMPETKYAVIDAAQNDELLFMRSHKIVGCGWISCPIRQSKFLLPCFICSRADEAVSCCQIELEIEVADLIIHSPETDTDWSKCAPVRVISFDIEAPGKERKAATPFSKASYYFPKYETDPVIQIGNYLKIQGETDPPGAVIFTLKSCAAIDGVEVRSFEDEASMLDSWAQFVRETDPDVLTGYNIDWFDLPFLIGRAEMNGLTKFPFLSRMKDLKSRVSEIYLKSDTGEKRMRKHVNLNGRISFDMMTVICRGYDRISTKLNDVSLKFLGDQKKQDVTFDMLPALQSGDENSRRRIALYCLKDSLLPLHLNNRTMSLVNYIDMAKSAGVPLRYLLGCNEVHFGNTFVDGTIFIDVESRVQLHRREIGFGNHNGNNCFSFRHCYRMPPFDNTLQPPAYSVRIRRKSDFCPSPPATQH